MELNKLNINELINLRANMILERKDISEISDLIELKEINEDGDGGIGMSGGGVAYANASIGGMGDVVSSQPSSYAGVTTEPGYTSGGGTVGSGDVSIPYNSGSNKKMFQKSKLDDRHGTSKRRKNKILRGLKDVFSKRQDFTAGQGAVKGKKVMNFNDFNKDDMNKVTKVTQ